MVWCFLINTVLKKANLAKMITPEMAKLGPDNNTTVAILAQDHPYGSTNLALQLQRALCLTQCHKMKGMMHLLIGFALSCWGAQAQWDVVDQMIEKFKFLPNASFSAGDAGGCRHTFEKGSLKMDTQIIMASSSKFPAAVAVAGAVHDGHLSFDTKVHDVCFMVDQGCKGQ